jgi:hypothetical protein
MRFLRFSIAIIRPKFKKTSHISVHGSKQVAKDVEGFFINTFIFYLDCSQICLNLPSCGSSPLWLHQKIDPKTKISLLSLSTSGRFSQIGDDPQEDLAKFS